ncbi:hypothetical protein WA026_002598 [Henosepilachna vigintioctopunctata]|uniref:Uncharacterized protein n=1 Tax=Henosepilachna vigintioctopunctata TaxID=420089 RepID=A0AAW1TZX4_9CUCU
MLISARIQILGPSPRHGSPRNFDINMAKKCQGLPSPKRRISEICDERGKLHIMFEMVEFRRCPLWIFQQTKCGQSNLEKLHNATKNLKSPCTKIKNRKLNTTIKCINQLSNELKNAGVDTTTVINVLSAAKNMTGEFKFN